jgi:hypothetical protein
MDHEGYETSYFKILSWHLHAETKGNHTQCLSGLSKIMKNILNFIRRDFLQGAKHLNMTRH